MMKSNKNAALFLIIIFSLPRGSNIFAMEMSVKPPAARIVQEAFKEAFQTIVIPCSYISLAKELYVLGKDTKSLVLPNVEEQVSYLEKKKEIQTIMARKAFEKCLINARNELGSSANCAEEEFIFALRAGKEKAAKKKAIFNKYKKS